MSCHLMVVTLGRIPPVLPWADWGCCKGFDKASLYILTKIYFLFKEIATSSKLTYLCSLPWSRNFKIPPQKKILLAQHSLPPAGSSNKTEATNRAVNNIPQHHPKIAPLRAKNVHLCTCHFLFWHLSWLLVCLLNWIDVKAACSGYVFQCHKTCLGVSWCWKVAWPKQVHRFC